MEWRHTLFTTSRWSSSYTISNGIGCTQGHWYFKRLSKTLTPTSVCSLQNNNQIQGLHPQGLANSVVYIKMSAN